MDGPDKDEKLQQLFSPLLRAKRKQNSSKTQSFILDSIKTGNVYCKENHNGPLAIKSGSQGRNAANVFIGFPTERAIYSKDVI